VLFGHASDSSSYYFLDFPHHDVGEQVDGIHATELRKCFFDWNKGCEYAKYTSEKMQNWLFAWKNHNEKEYRWLQYEFKSVEDYKEPYKSQKYPPIFVTTDAIVHCGTDVLMIKRKKHPGQDLYAFPGGHLEANETIENCVFRELQEETGLDLKSIKYVATPPVIFDSVNRDPRGRYLSNVFVFSLSCKPEVKGADDASSAEWINIKDLRADMTAFDHYKILHKMQGYTEDFRIVH
jgi:bifunctional NMN adenylyltransferase/nudix hydrolase